MAISRYENTVVLLDKLMFATQTDYAGIKQDIENGILSTIEYTVKPLDRLDIIANKFYGESKYWWIIAIANNIGWAMQVMPGTILLIPENSDAIISRLGS